MDESNLLRIIMLGPSLSVKGGISSVEKLILQQISSKVQIRHIATHEEGSVALRVLVFGRALGELVWRILLEDVNLVHIHLSQRGSAFRKAILTALVLLFRKPVILHAHGSEFRLFYSKLTPRIKQLLGWVFSRCSRFIVLSESWKNFYITSLGLKDEQVVVLANPVKLPPQVPHRPSSKEVNLLFLGRIGQRKGAFDLIKAFAALPIEQKNQAKLIIGGDGEVEQAKSLVQSLNLTAYITVPGWVEPEQRDELLAKADVFILPSYNEGLPMAILEAMGWGLPAITTPVGGIPELVTNRKDGLLVNPGNIEQLLEAIKSLIKNESLRLKLGDNAKKRVAPFDIQNYCVSLLEIYRSAVRSLS